MLRETTKTIGTQGTQTTHVSEQWAIEGIRRCELKFPR